MPLGRVERLQIMLTDEELAAIDDWRFERRMPTRAAAVRELPRQQRNNCGGRSSTPSNQVSQSDGRKHAPTRAFLFVCPRGSPRFFGSPVIASVSAFRSRASRASRDSRYVHGMLF